MSDPIPDAPETAETRPRRSRRRAWIGAGGALVLAAATLATLALRSEAAPGAEKTAAAEKTAETPKKAPVPVEVAEVTSGPISSYLTATANLAAESEVQVLAEVEGRVEEVRVEEGDRVQKGEILALLARGDAQIALEKARVREDNAKSVLQRGRELAKDELISREELDKRDADYKIAHQERAEAEWNLEKTHIRAPFAGRVSLRSVQAGQHVRPGDELFQVTDFDPLLARIYLPEKDVLGLVPGRGVKLALNADPQVRFAGRIRQVSPVVDPATGTIKVTIEAVAPPHEVRPGSFVTVRIVRQTRPQAVLLPKEAVVKELQKAHVFVAGPEVAQRREVSLGLEEGDRVEALAGVEPGDRVIVAGQGGLKDGSPIRVVEGDGAPAEGR